MCRRPRNPERLEALPPFEQRRYSGSQGIDTFDPTNPLEILLDPLTVLIQVNAAFRPKERCGPLRFRPTVVRAYSASGYATSMGDTVRSGKEGACWIHC